MVAVKQTLTITTHLDRVEIKNWWWLDITFFAILGWGTILSGIALILLVISINTWMCYLPLITEEILCRQQVELEAVIAIFCFFVDNNRGRCDDLWLM